MSTESKADRIARIRERVDAATEGPWVIRDMSDTEYRGPEDGTGWWWVWQESRLPHYGGVAEISESSDQDGGILQAAIDDNRTGVQEHADAEFIANAREDVPFLLEEIEYLRKLHLVDLEVIGDLEHRTTKAEAERDAAVALIEKLRAYWLYGPVGKNKFYINGFPDRLAQLGDLFDEDTETFMRDLLSSPAESAEATDERDDRESEFETFVNSFNGDEAGDIDEVFSVLGDHGWAMRGGNDVRAVFDKARAALGAEEQQ